MHHALKALTTLGFSFSFSFLFFAFSSFCSVTREVQVAVPFPAWEAAAAAEEAPTARPSPVPFNHGAFVSQPQVLRAEECKHYMAEAERLGLESVEWEYPKEYRVCSPALVVNPLVCVFVQSVDRISYPSGLHARGVSGRSAGQGALATAARDAGQHKFGRGPPHGVRQRGHLGLFF